MRFVSIQKTLLGFICTKLHLYFHHTMLFCIKNAGLGQQVAAGWGADMDNKTKVGFDLR